MIYTLEYRSEFMKSETREEEFAYHEKERAPYFEGWYIKTVNEELSFAVILGISLTKEGRTAFIQTNSTLCPSTYTSYEEEDIEIRRDPFRIQIGRTVLEKHQLILNLDNGLRCHLYFDKLTELKGNNYMPTIMGPFSYWKHMECIHSITSLHHFVRGKLMFGDHIYELPNAIGYMEKDRGRSFPPSYLWYQSNHCGIQDTCFFMSIARIPVGIASFQGCICILWIDGKQYRFASYLGCRIVKRKEVYILKQYPYKLLVRFSAKDACLLKAPKLGDMNKEVMESLHGEAIVHLYKREKKLYQLHFEKGGYEQLE